MTSRLQALALAFVFFVAGAASAEKPLAFRPDEASLSWGPCPGIFPSGCAIAVLHGNPTAANADIFLRLQPGTRLPDHVHSSAERMMLSTGRLRVKYQGSDQVVLQPGSYAYGPSRLAHDAECISRDACTLFIAFEGPVDAHLAEQTRP